MSALANSPAWLALQTHREKLEQSGFRCAEQLRDSRRFTEFSLQHEQLLLDYSRNLCTGETMELLLQLAQQQAVPHAISAMFAGAEINTTEQRAALHVALRIPAASNRHPEIVANLNKMNGFVSAIHSGEWTGFDGQRITDVVNIGIGGSDLGPAMVTQALENYAAGHVRLHFVSNIDPQHVQSTLAGLDPATTLFIIASKSFRTEETCANAEQARQWLMCHCPDETNIAKHFVAVSANLEAAQAFGIAPENLFPVWDWVGGRYSLWSAIGLAIALAVGMQEFRHLLAGAHAMDQHFAKAPLEKNMPVILALLSIWYGGMFDARSSALVPYSHLLRQLPLFLQQLSMESLGKSVSNKGEALTTRTGEIIWGAQGSNSQHSFFQLLHQGTEFIPIDFIAVVKAFDSKNRTQQRMLLANCLSQGMALIQGRENQQQAHRNYPGNRPSNLLLLAELNPYNLGSLLALYEHKVYIQSVIWEINAFDQWGVELGKELSATVLKALNDNNASKQLDSSSKGLIQKIHEWS